jgi:hypothetical protein
MLNANGSWQGLRRRHQRVVDLRENWFSPEILDVVDGTLVEFNCGDSCSY